MITAYVRAGDLRVPETALFHYLRMFQEQYGIRHLRVDPGDSSSVRAAVRWARSQDIPVSHQGIPSLVIVPDQPCSYTPGTEINDKARIDRGQAHQRPGLPHLRRRLAQATVNTTAAPGHRGLAHPGPAGTTLLNATRLSPKPHTGAVAHELP